LLLLQELLSLKRPLLGLIALELLQQEEVVEAALVVDLTTNNFMGNDGIAPPKHVVQVLRNNKG
jgi:hypothetical protein